MFHLREKCALVYVPFFVSSPATMSNAEPEVIDGQVDEDDSDISSDDDAPELEGDAAGETSPPTLSLFFCHNWDRKWKIDWFVFMEVCARAKSPLAR